MNLQDPGSSMGFMVFIFLPKIFENTHNFKCYSLFECIFVNITHVFMHAHNKLRMFQKEQRVSLLIDFRFILYILLGD